MLPVAANVFSPWRMRVFMLGNPSPFRLSTRMKQRRSDRLTAVRLLTDNTSCSESIPSVTYICSRISIISPSVRKGMRSRSSLVAVVMSTGFASRSHSRSYTSSQSCASPSSSIRALKIGSHWRAPPLLPSSCAWMWLAEARMRRMERMSGLKVMEWGINQTSAIRIRTRMALDYR